MGRKTNETLKFLVMTFIGVVFGFLIGISISVVYISKLQMNPANYVPATVLPNVNQQFEGVQGQNQTLTNTSVSEMLNWIPSNPRGAERLPPGVVAFESDFYLRRLWSEPREDVPKKPKYLVTFTVGYDQRKNIEASIKEFSDEFTVMLFHCDGRTSEWEGFEWSKRAIHVSSKTDKMVVRQAFSAS